MRGETYERPTLALARADQLMTLVPLPRTPASVTASSSAGVPATYSVFSFFNALRGPASFTYVC